MRWFFVFAAAMAIGSASLSASAVAAPLEAYGRLPNLEQVEISPDGASLAFVMTNGEMRRIVVQRIVDGQVLGGLNLGEAKLRSLQWADSQRLLITTSVTGYAVGVESSREEWYLAQVYDLAKRRGYPLMRGVDDAMNVIYGTPEIRPIDGHVVVFFRGVTFVDNEGVEGLFKTDLTTDRSALVKAGATTTRDWLVDAAGQPVAEARYAEANGRWSLLVRTAAHGWIETRAIVAPVDSPSIDGLSRDGRSVLVQVFENGETKLYDVSIADGTWSAGAPDNYREHIRDPVSRAWIGGVNLDGDELRYTFFDTQVDRLWQATAKAYPGQIVNLASWSADRKKLVVRVDSPDDGAAYALVDLETKRGVWIGDEYTGLKAADISPVTPVTYKAADGLVITGYLTLPRGKQATNLPLVVLPHGGPEARNEPGFDWWSQAVASRGYAVLRPNFRGSSGFTTGFVTAGYGQWGRKMQTDLSDGVRYLAAKGTIDPKRVCIFGGSYGGYAALAGATLDPGVYRCAVSLAGPSDLRRMLRTDQSEQRSKNNESLRYWDRFMAAKGIDDPALAAISPADQAAKATIPILLIHGKDDTVVPFEQSQIMADALRRAGKPVTLVTLKGEDHWLSRGKTRLQMLTAAMAFIEANNPPN